MIKNNDHAIKKNNTKKSNNLKRCIALPIHSQTLTLILALIITIVSIFSCFIALNLRAKPKIMTEKFFIKHADGTFSYAEAVLPIKNHGQLPLVAMAHGFKGTLNSGGARELSERLAKSGIAAVRVSFDPYKRKDISSAQTHFYTLSTMQDDMNYAISYMISNHHIDSSRIGIHARSMGGRIAMRMCNEKNDYDFKAMTLVAPAGNGTAMIDYMGGVANWNKMKEYAISKGFIEHQGLYLTPDWFFEFESYNPCKSAYKFGNHPVLVFCNTLDYVVTPQTSRECASSYKNSRVIEVTTNNYHGYEMGYKNSNLKEYIMNEIVSFFMNNL